MSYQGNGYGPPQQNPYGSAQKIPRRPVQSEQHNICTEPSHPNGPGSPPPYPPRSSQQQYITAQERQTLLNAGVPAEELPRQKQDDIHTSTHAVAPTSGDASAFPAWPTEPARLGRMGFFSRFIVPAFNILLAILPILFIVLGALAKSLDQRLVSDHSWGLNLITATRYGVTIYPILFAAIIGNVMQSTAAWLAERGATIMVLEQLTGSTALFATLTTQFQLHAWNYRALLLILLWALSPLGGQGNLRLISVENQAVSSESPVWSLNTGMNNSVSLFNEDTSPQIDPINAVYLSSLIAPNQTQSGTQDTWGNIKVPRIESLTPNSPQSNQWYPVPSTDISYSSLVGIPVAAIPNRGNSTFIMSSSYYSLSCPKGPELIPSDNEVVWSDADHTNSSTTGGIGGYVKGSHQPVIGTGSSRYYKDGSWVTTFSIGSFGPFTDYGKTASKPMSIYFQSETDDISNDNDAITALNCVITFTNVDSRVECQGQTCGVTSMRLSPGRPYPDLNTPLGDSQLAWEYFDNFEVASGYYNSLGHYTTNSLTEQYMFYGSSPLAFPDRAVPTNLSKIAGDDLTVRLGRLMNSFWLPSLDPMNMVGTHPSAADLASGNKTTIGGFVAQKNTAQVTTLEEIFVCHDEWLAILLISAFMLLLCALVGLVLKFWTRGPDIFGHVASFTRDNPYIRVPAGGSTLDGFERARLLKRVRVRVGDVKGGDDVGYVAFMGVDGEGQGYVEGRTGLDQRRLYD